MHRLDPTTWRTQRGLASTWWRACRDPLDEAGRINPQVTRFALSGRAFLRCGPQSSRFTNQHASGVRRPLSEACEHPTATGKSGCGPTASWYPAVRWCGSCAANASWAGNFGSEVLAMRGCSRAIWSSRNTLTAYPDPNRKPRRWMAGVITTLQRPIGRPVTTRRPLF